jgi:hypothetical protein
VYFERLFKGGEFRESSSGIARIDLESSLKAGAFPLLLDYQYKPWQKFEFTAENSLLLYELAEYFDIPQLRKDAVDFWEVDVDPRNCHVYYDRASRCGNDSVLQRVRHVCVDYILDVCENRELFQSTPPDFWLAVLRQLEAWQYCPARQELIGNALAGALLQENEPEYFSAELFLALTDASFVPEVTDVGTALALLRCEIRVLGDNLAAAPTSESLSCLQLRCMETLKRSLAGEPDVDKRAEFQREVLGRLRSAHPRLAEAFLTEALELERAKVKELSRRTKANPPPGSPSRQRRRPHHA